MSILKNIGLVSDTTPVMDVKKDSKEEIDSFLHYNLEEYKNDIAFLFMVGPFVCGLEPSDEERIKFWILNVDHELAELTAERSFELKSWMMYYVPSQKIFRIPLAELHKVIQHLTRLSRLSSFF